MQWVVNSAVSKVVRMVVRWVDPTVVLWADRSAVWWAVRLVVWVVRWAVRWAAWWVEKRADRSVGMWDRRPKSIDTPYDCRDQRIKIDCSLFLPACKEMKMQRHFHPHP